MLFPLVKLMFNISSVSIGFGCSIREGSRYRYRLIPPSGSSQINRFVDPGIGKIPVGYDTIEKIVPTRRIR